MNNYEMEALWEAEHDMRTIGEPTSERTDEESDEISDLEFAMLMIHPEIDRDPTFDQ